MSEKVIREDDIYWEFAHMIEGIYNKPSYLTKQEKLSIFEDVVKDLIKDFRYILKAESVDGVVSPEK